MASRGTSRKMTADRQQELEVAAAVAREAVTQLHADYAIALIRHADGQVSSRRMLDIYLRLLGLVGYAADMVSNRVLASLGQPRPSLTTGRAQPAGHVDPAAGNDPAPRDEHAEPMPEPESILRTLRRRLRGRVNDRLRRTVELQTGAAQAALLDLHVRHAHGFVRLLDGALSTSDACALYTESVPVPQNFASVLYVLVLDRIATDDLHSWPAAASIATTAQAANERPSTSQQPPSRNDMTGRNGRHRARRPA